MNKAPTINQIEYAEEDHDKAERLAAHMGYTQTAYTSSSALWGLICLADNLKHNPRGKANGGCIIKTAQFGLMFVQDCEDLHFES